MDILVASSNSRVLLLISLRVHLVLVAVFIFPICLIGILNQILVINIHVQILEFALLYFVALVIFAHLAIRVRSTHLHDLLVLHVAVSHVVFGRLWLKSKSDRRSVHRPSTSESSRCRRDAHLVPSYDTIWIQSQLCFGLDRIHINLLFGYVLPGYRCSRRYLVVHVSMMVPLDLRREVPLLTSIMISYHTSGFGQAIDFLLGLGGLKMLGVVIATHLHALHVILLLLCRPDNVVGISAEIHGR